jgi:hypothetical protein
MSVLIVEAEPLWYVPHEHLYRYDNETRIRHEHSVTIQHHGNWSNRWHLHVETESWDENRRRYNHG